MNECLGLLDQLFIQREYLGLMSAKNVVVECAGIQ